MNASAATAYASSLSWDMLGDLAPTRQRQDPACRVEGCGLPSHLYSLCRTHARAYERSGGDPLGLRHKTREAFLSAVHVFGDDPENSSAQLALGEAAVRWMSARCGRAIPPHESGAGIGGVDGVELRAAALAYTEYDSEAPLAGFLAASQRLDAAVLAFARRLLSLGAPPRPSPQLVLEAA